MSFPFVGPGEQAGSRYKNLIQSSQPIPSLLRPIWLPTSHRGQRFFRKRNKKKQTPEGALGSNLKYHPLKLLGDSVIPGPPNSYNLWKPWSKAVKMATCPIKGLVDLWRKKVEQQSHILNFKSRSCRSSQGWVRVNPLLVAKPVDLDRVLQVLKDF